MRKTKLTNLIISALFMSIGLVLPFLTGQIPQIGKMMLPMHLPVLLCGFVCGWQYGLCVGFILPILRGFIFATPVFFPTGLIMAFELAAYGFFSGFIFNLFKKQNLFSVYASLFFAMLLGRVVKCVVQFIVLGFTDEGFVLTAFFAGAFVNAVPGIVLQLILIPLILLILDKTHLIKFKGKECLR